MWTTWINRVNEAGEEIKFSSPDTKMKVLFLDIDGVLNSARSAVALGGYPWSAEENLNKFDHIALKLIRKLCKDHNVLIVLSSTWRKDPQWFKLKKQLNLPIIDRTPMKIDSTRGEEIAMFLRNNSYEIEKYAIIDDDSDMLPEQLPFFVQTSGLNGLSFENYRQLEKILK